MKCFSATEQKSEKRRADLRGSVTPMAAILTCSVFFLNLVMLDVCRIRTMKKLTEDVNELAVSSVLSCFDRTLEADYGLYCVKGERKTELENRYREIAEGKDLITEAASALFGGGEFPAFRLMEKRLTGANLKFDGNIGDKEILRQQIQDLMRYKAWGNLAEFAAGQLTDVMNLGKQLNAEKLMEKIDALERDAASAKAELLVALNGAAEDLPDGVNGFFDSVFAKPMPGQKAELLGSIPGVGISVGKKEKERITAAIQALGAGAVFYGDFNRKGLELADRIVDILEEEAILVKTAEDYLKNGGQNDLHSARLEEKVLEIKGGISDGGMRVISQKLGKNIENLSQVTAAGNALSDRLQNQNVIRIEDVRAYLKTAEDAYFAYEAVDFAYRPVTAQDIPVKHVKVTDVTNTAKTFMGIQGAVIDDNIYEALPSYGHAGGIESLSGLTDYLRGADSWNLGESFLASAEKTAAYFADPIAESLEDYYVDAYITSYFGNAMEIRDVNAHYLRAETEYLIAGGRSDRANLNEIYAALVALRTCFNMLDISADEEKHGLVQEMGAAMSLISEGFGTEIYSTYLTFVWGAAEAACDLKDLESGKKVPLVKRARDWHVALDGTALSGDGTEDGGSGSGADSNPTALDYGSYLRILLAMVPLEAKLYRIQDLLELNLFTKTGVYTEIETYYTKVEGECGFVTDTFVILNPMGKREYRWRFADEGQY